METIYNINTSYFAKYKGNNGVSIARISPKFYKGETCIELAPSYRLLTMYKTGEIVASTYKAIYYNETLNNLNPKFMADLLNNKVLLCYETPDKFCHRQLVAEWFENKLGIKVEELKF